jgi:ubiquinone/menaquinone biosynthesis C-methylase UbiE
MAYLSVASVPSREKEFWNSRSSGSYDRVRGLIGRAIGAFSSYPELRQLYDVRGLDILDYGCGRGYGALRAAENGAKRAFGFDISEAEIDEARRSAEELGLADGCTFLVADAHKTPFEDNQFDLVIGDGILHHLEVEKALLEIKRILKPGHAAYFVEPMAHNPFLRLGRALTPSARTDDEHPFTEEDWATCAKVFPNFEHFERELMTIPLMPLNLLLPPRQQTRLAERVHAMDRRLMNRQPKLSKYARLTFLILK